MSKKENKIIDNKKEFCYINIQVLKTLNDKRTGYETISPLSLKTDFLLYVFQRITTLSGVAVPYNTLLKGKV
uniref:Uncharacterized protein n=1 Tax=Bartonella schoenbuchensis TaxID=165694 RepID=A0A024LR47_9HYPH|nr:hypothetical protein BN1046_00580 [Bartonella schoenbuchensis]